MDLPTLLWIDLRVKRSDLELRHSLDGVCSAVVASGLDAINDLIAAADTDVLCFEFDYS